MTVSRPAPSTSNDDLIRRLDIVIGLLAIVVALQVVRVAHQVSGSFIPAFLVTLLFGLGVVTVTRSFLD